MKRFLFFMLQLMLMHCLIGQTIRGKVVDSDGIPIAYCNIVLLLLPDSTFIQGVVTDDSGSFSISEQKGRKLLQVSYLGYENLYLSDVSGDVGTLKLVSSSVQLDETVIVASRAAHKMRDGNLVTNIVGSPLGKERKTMDVLKKIPGMTISHGELEVFGLGNPVVYINNRKVANKDEIAMLDPANIKEIELITNPGAKYDAEGKAVLKIVTLSKEDGWALKLDMTAIQSRRFSDSESLSAAFNKKGLALSGFYSFDDERGKTRQEFLNELQDNDVLWEYNDLLKTNHTGKQHNYQLGVDYSLSNDHTIGVQYTGTHTSTKANANNLQNVYRQQVGFTEITSGSKHHVDRNYGRVNMFYIGKISPRLEMEVNADYAQNETNQTQLVNEESEAGNSKIDVATESNNDLYAAKIEMNYSINPGTFTLGGEFNKIEVNGWLTNPDDVIGDTKFENKENRQSYYFMYTKAWGAYSVNAGCRYEIVRSRMYDLLDETHTIKKDYSDWYPNLSVSASFSKVKSSLSYSVRTIRPAFSRLNSNVYYDNKYMMQIGNPQLQPQFSHNLQALFSYKDFSVRLGYSYIKDYINSVFESDGNVIMSSWKNYDKAQSFRTNISYTKKTGCWNTVFASGFSVPSFKIDCLDGRYNNNNVQYYFQTNNYVELPNAFMLSLDYMYNSGGSIGIYKFKPYHSLNLGIQRSFIEDKLNVSLHANDIFRTMIYKYDSRIGNIYFNQREDQNERYVSFNVVYRLNNVKSKYRGTGAANEEIKRL